MELLNVQSEKMFRFTSMIVLKFRSRHVWCDWMASGPWCGSLDATNLAANNSTPNRLVKHIWNCYQKKRFSSRIQNDFSLLKTRGTSSASFFVGRDRFKMNDEFEWIFRTISWITHKSEIDFVLFNGEKVSLEARLNLYWTKTTSDGLESAHSISTKNHLIWRKKDKSKCKISQVGTLRITSKWNFNNWLFHQAMNSWVPYTCLVNLVWLWDKPDVLILVLTFI